MTATKNMKESMTRQQHHLNIKKATHFIAVLLLAYMPTGLGGALRNSTNDEAKCICTGKTIEDDNGFCVSAITTAVYRREISKLKSDCEYKLATAMNTKPCPTMKAPEASSCPSCAPPTQESSFSAMHWLLVGFAVGVCLTLLLGAGTGTAIRIYRNTKGIGLGATDNIHGKPEGNQAPEDQSLLSEKSEGRDLSRSNSTSSQASTDRVLEHPDDDLIGLSRGTSSNIPSEFRRSPSSDKCKEHDCATEEYIGVTNDLPQENGKSSVPSIHVTPDTQPKQVL